MEQASASMTCLAFSMTRRSTSSMSREDEIMGPTSRMLISLALSRLSFSISAFSL